jgi:lambda family phage portal protein
MFSALRAFIHKATAPPAAERSYDAATGGRRFDKTAATPSQITAGLAGREPAARRARYAANNAPLGASALAVWQGEAVGSGMRPAAQTGDSALDKEIDAAFADWAARADFFATTSFYALQALAAGRMFVDGEIFILLVIDPATGELRLKALDNAQMVSTLYQELAGGGIIVSGVECNEGGRPIAYHIYKRWIPALPLLTGLTIYRVLAADVVHGFICETPGQVRGMTRFAASLLRLHEYDQFVDAQVVRQKVGALLCGFVTDADGTLMQEGAAPGEASLEPGTMQRLRPGESVNFSDPPEIGSESNEFQRALIREIAAGLGIPSFMLDHDMSQVNFSSARVAIIAFRRRIDAWQQHFAHQVLRPIYRRWLTLEILAGRINAPLTEAVLRHKWIAPRAEWLDPLKDAQATNLAIGAGLTSRREAVAALGVNVEELDQEIAADRAREAGLGLTFARASSPQPAKGDQENVSPSADA